VVEILSKQPNLGTLELDEEAIEEPTPFSAA